MNNGSAHMLRAISNQLDRKIIPRLNDADAIERASLSARVLQYLAADIDILAEVAEKVAPHIRETISIAMGALPPAIMGELLDDWRRQYLAIKPETGLASQREIRELRNLVSLIVRKCSDITADLPEGDARTDINGVIACLAKQDFNWLNAYAAAYQRQADDFAPKEGSPSREEPANVDEVTPESLTDYLREHFPNSPDIRATQVIAIPGGKSKKTWLISVQGTDELPAEIVMRQDYQLHYEGTRVKDEYLPLSKLAALQLPVPEPLYLEAQSTGLGPPFILMARASGSPPGTYFGLKEKCPGAFIDLAKTLAKIHTANADELGYVKGPEPENSLTHLINNYQKKWRDNTNKPSPLIDFAFTWAQEICRMDRGMVAVVHGDAGPHNMLVENDHLQLLLDWEFAHVGDPAEDLGIVRVYAEDLMPWQQFMQVYLEAGGLPVPDRRIEMAMLLHYLKGACLVAVSNRNFEEGWTEEFIKGGTAFAGLRQIEAIVANLLNRFNAIQQ